MCTLNTHIKNNVHYSCKIKSNRDILYSFRKQPSKTESSKCNTSWEGYNSSVHWLQQCMHMQSKGQKIWIIAIERYIISRRSAPKTFKILIKKGKSRKKEYQKNLHYSYRERRNSMEEGYLKMCNFDKKVKYIIHHENAK